MPDEAAPERACLRPGRWQHGPGVRRAPADATLARTEDGVGYETLEIAREDGILTLSLSRPDRLNALTTQMLEELLRVFDEIDADDGVRAVIVTGAGRAFCAGADLGGGGGTFDTSRATGGVPRDG